MIRPLLLLFAAILTSFAQNLVRVEPRPSDALFANPGMGWQTFHRFADEDRNLQGLPSSSAYFRFYWREIEPRDGAIDFAKFDQLLARASKARQKLAFRIMTTGSSEYMDVPNWLKEKGCKGVEFEFEGRQHWVPDFEDPLFWSAHMRLIDQLGKRYDGNPDLDLVDIGSVGLWGEWHMSGTKSAATGQAVPLPSVAKRLAIIDAWRKAFPNHNHVMLIGSEEGMALASKHGYGWRADCLGDMGGFSKNWNHMKDFYLQQLERTGARDVWTNAPVAYETCWDMRKWKSAGWDIDFIFDYALQTHASYINNKSAPIPEGTRPQIERLLQKLGYRLVVKAVEHPASIRADDTLKVAIDWENEGVAPPYRSEMVALRLASKSAATPPAVLATTQLIRGWLPGAKRTELELAIPTNLVPGNYELSLGVIDPRTKKPAVRLAIEPRDPEGWHPVSAISIVH